MSTAPERPIARVSAGAMTALSLVALITVLSAFVWPPDPAQTDEGARAHIFQLALGLLVPAGLFYLGTADWTRPTRAARPVALSAFAACLALGLLYYLEHLSR